jgi:hypothetical protein
MVRDQINMSVIVADRLVRRDLPNPARWSLGTVLPLSEEQVNHYLGKDADYKPDSMLSSPFFLDAAIRYDVHGTRRWQASEQFLLAHGGIQESALAALAAAAYEAYRQSRSRVFDRADFVGTTGEAAVSALESSGILVSSGEGERFFLHHMLHDYLAARHFSGWQSAQWTPEALSALTFESSSFDAIELVFEQLPSDRADLFLKQLYDWNLYAAGYALAQAREADAIVGTEMRTMIFAMLAEKRFDVILATRQRANDALALMQLSDARPYRDAQSIQEIFAALRDVQSDEAWFNVWSSIFRTSPESKLDGDTLASIRSPDSTIGWTVANVAKRTALDTDAAEKLVTWLRDEVNGTVRWRIAHVLGAVPSSDASDQLLELLDTDPENSVRYGAIRSLVELAAKADKVLQSSVEQAILARATVISQQPRIVGELRSALLLDPAVVTPNWVGFVVNVVRALFLTVESTGERDLWRRCLTDAQMLYTGDKSGGLEE